MKAKYLGETCLSLIHGKVYDVISVERDWLRIVDESEEDYLFDPEEFEIIEE